jgi:hypothetical protein
MSISARSALAVAAILALGSVTACGSSSNTVTPGSTAPAAPASSAAAPAPEAKTNGVFGDTITFPSGIAVKVTPAVVPAAQYAYGAVEGKIVTFDVSVTNGSKEEINGALMGSPKVTYGAQGTAAQSANDIQAGIGAAYLSTILPGETQTVKVGFGIPAAGFADVRVEIMAPNFTDKAAIFKGPVG